MSGRSKIRIIHEEIEGDIRNAIYNDGHGYMSLKTSDKQKTVRYFVSKEELAQCYNKYRCIVIHL
ncbi:hypothetical protein TVAG_016790 [Trichomonas vaginalis G3]|uniref:Uncharacterized protein n=1 Tax=Trichomonas vaginalis (strain ATCC PRA-98 / G3) TaxID=412133 RepID=A2ER17_TRIV3|nr:hypothetical protein TVAGG3_0535210 [Trichomonas vaginalis G3]EAY04907.1 hypothetical protein TVAG_016790 [Trichomonas vaginalis G3]KAI5519435.1 hypothetical protein TVAGG3_0535210 [Trichomonas vaginalis G3]|eukprot:XP_001317130.1 hypothetical protein [Trichomonas vaginalis G3]